MEIYKAVGLMSGTSLDGLDITYCEFEKSKGAWRHEIILAETFTYDKEWKHRLSKLVNATALEMMETHVELGRLFGELTKGFLDKNNINPDLIASHGHTVFHQPEKGFTLQIGSGYEILKACRIKVVYDFRSLDVTLGGQGAPLVPIGDKLLFGNYEYCLNLGGISNISFEMDKGRIAFDIAPHNIVLNHLSKMLGLEFDPNGINASKGKLNEDLFQQLNQLEYYKLPFPKSLGIEYIEKSFFPVINVTGIPVEDKLHTFNHHVAFQIDREIKKTATSKKGKLLVTGGGTHNGFFIGLLEKYAAGKYSLEVPDEKTIDFKEAMIFAFLGVLRVREEVNALRSVTGASQDSCTGVILEHFNQ